MHLKMLSGNWRLVLDVSNIHNNPYVILFLTRSYSFYNTGKWWKQSSTHCSCLRWVDLSIAILWRNTSMHCDVILPDCPQNVSKGARAFSRRRQVAYQSLIIHRCFHWLVCKKPIYIIRCGKSSIFQTTFIYFPKNSDNVIYRARGTQESKPLTEPVYCKERETIRPVWLKDTLIQIVIPSQQFYVPRTFPKRSPQTIKNVPM